MIKIILLLSIFVLLQIAFEAHGEALPQTKAEYCSRFQDGRQTAQDLSSDPSNLMAFKNNGGLFNGGVCWWHSRFQRNILYLGIFRPDLPKLKTSKEVEALIKKVRDGDSVVTIPGYANLFDFSTDYQKLIQSELNDWQLYDGVVLGSWINGLKGDSKVPVAQMQRMMSEVFDYVSVKKKIAYEKLQIKGITSHAWLIVGMKQGPGGFDVGYVDSNHPRMSELFTYKYEDQSFFLKAYGDFVPYLEFKREEERILDAGKTYCGLKHEFVSEDKKKEDYERDLAEAKAAL